MPPKAKFSKEEIVAAAMSIVEEYGEDSLTARSLGDALGSSARPIFTVFSGMDEVWSAVVTAAKSVYYDYVERGLQETPAFKGVGQSYIKFAAERPKLFRILFMRENKTVPEIDEVLKLIEEHYPEIIRSVTESYGFEEDVSKKLYLHMWLYTHGIAVLTATKVCAFSEERISEMLSEVCISLIKKFKTEGLE